LVRKDDRIGFGKVLGRLGVPVNIPIDDDGPIGRDPHPLDTGRGNNEIILGVDTQVLFRAPCRRIGENGMGSGDIKNGA
jgi:hypothetical protein